MVFLAIARAMVHTRSNPRLCKSYIWNLARGVNGNRIFLSKFFIVFHYFRNVSKERLRRRPLWREVARTKVKKTTFVFCKLFHTQSSSLDSVYFVSFQAYSTLCCVKCYVLLDPFCTMFLTIVFDFPIIFSQKSHPDTKSWSSHISIDCHKSGPLRSGEKTGFNSSSYANRRVTCKEAPFGTWFWSRSANKINIQLAVKKERLGKGLADAFTIQKIEHKDVVKLFKRQLINLKRFAEFTDVKLLITCAGVILLQGEQSGVTEIVSKIWRRMNEISKGLFEII